MRKDATLNATNWQEKAPVLIPIATVSAFTGAIRYVIQYRSTALCIDFPLQFVCFCVARMEALYTAHHPHISYGLCVYCQSFQSLTNSVLIVHDNETITRQDF